MAYQDLNQFINQIYGWGDGSGEASALLALAGSASNVAIGGNPPYTVSDFLTYHPQFTGTPINVQGTLDGTTGVISNLSSVAGLAAGQLVAGPGIVAGSNILSLTPGPIRTTAITENGGINIVVISSVGIVNGQPCSGPGIQSGSVVLNVIGSTVTLSQAATADGVNVLVQFGSNPSVTISNPTTLTGVQTLQVYTNPLVPIPILKSFINVASASIQSVRWCELWYVAMGWYIAHNCIMFLRSFAQGSGSSISQVVAAGLAIGIQTSKSAGDVSVGMSVITGLEDWGSFQLTLPGQQFATYAKAIGSGPMLLL